MYPGLFRGRLIPTVLLWLGFFYPGLSQLHAQSVPAGMPAVRLSAAGVVRHVVAQSDGRVIIAGQFTSVNGVPRSNLARLNRDGSVDTAWDVPVERGEGVRGSSVSALCVSGDYLYIGGDFERVSGLVRLGVARVGLGDFGEVDLEWQPSVQDALVMVVDDQFAYMAAVANGETKQRLFKVSLDGGGSVDPDWNPNPVGSFGLPVTALALEGGSLFVGGDFTQIGGQSLSGLAKVSVEGVGLANPSWAPDPDGPVNALLVHSGFVYVAGEFISVGGAQRNSIARVQLAGVGEADSLWNPNPSLGGVFAVSVDGDNVYLGGQFEFLDGTPRNGLAKVSGTGIGEIDQHWDPAAEQGTLIHSVLPVGNSVYVGGALARLNGELTLGLGKVDRLVGEIDDDFRCQVEKVGHVNAIAQQPDGKLVLGGLFSLVDGLERRNLVRLNVDGEVDTQWNPSADSEVFDIAVAEDAMFVAGRFLTIGGVSRRYVAKLPFTRTDTVDVDWNPNPSDAPFVPGRRFRRGATDIEVVGGDLIVAGFFQSIGGQPRPYIAKLDAAGTGQADPLWNPNPDGAVTSIASDGTSLFVAGEFTQVGGQPRVRFAKLELNGAGAADPLWIPNAIAPQLISPASDPFEPLLALADTHLYVSGFFTNIGTLARTNLAKLSLDGAGTADPLWRPDPVSEIAPLALGSEVTALAASEDSVFVGLLYDGDRPLLSKRRQAGEGDQDPNWNHTVNRAVRAVLPEGRGAYVGGEFSQVSDLLRSGFASLPEISAPVILIEPGPVLEILPNPVDGAEVTHFFVESITGGTLFRHDESTALTPGEFITVNEGGMGLTFVTSPGQTGEVRVASSLDDLPAAVGAAFSSVLLSSSIPPTQQVSVAFSQEAYFVGEGIPGVSFETLVVGLEKRGVGELTVRLRAVNGTATAGTDFQPIDQIVNFAADVNHAEVSILMLPDFADEGDEVFLLELSSATGGIIRNPNRVSVTILESNVTQYASCLTTQPPPALPEATGVLTVELEPVEAAGQWRLEGGIDWHDSGESIGGLVLANYGVEFRPSEGFLEPETVVVPVDAGVTNVVQSSYTRLVGARMGRFAIHVEPATVATNEVMELRGRWRRAGDLDWLNSDEEVRLVEGTHLIEFESVPNRATPFARHYRVFAGQAQVATVTYEHSIDFGGEVPSVLTATEATETDPYQFNGQIRSSVGSGSGVVVKERVVLTGAHVLFDDVTLSYATDAKWFHRRHRGDFEPPAQQPRGWYVFEGYAAQRELDASPGVSSTTSRQFDAAALYFVEGEDDQNRPGNGGYGGFVVSTNRPSDWLLSSRMKMLVGYPVDQVADGDVGRMHATVPGDLVFGHTGGSVYETSDIRSFPGNSGGPLYVLHDNGSYYPAAIYLGGLVDTRVRVIDNDVVDLIVRAESSGDGSGNNTGGGVLYWDPGTSSSGYHSGRLKVTLGPNEAVAAGGAWRIVQSDTDFSEYFQDQDTVTARGISVFKIELLPIPGFVTPPVRLVTVQRNYVIPIEMEYLRQPMIRDGVFETWMSFPADVEYEVQAASDVVNGPWTRVAEGITTSGVVHYSEPVLTNVQERFIRVREK